MSNNNMNLHKASKAKKDEFYTQLSDIEKELKHYKGYFKGKVVLCNCDDPQESNFWKYFSLNFEFLGLKKLIATHFDYNPTYKLELIADINKDGKVNGLDTIKTPFKQNGDFRSPECVDILKEADVVVTNPPFSLFREYIAQLVQYNKKFLVIGNMNAITYKETFSLIKDNKVWLGCTNPKEFRMPDSYPLLGSSFVDGNGNKVAKFGNICWFTNLHHKKRNDELILYKKYNEKDYPKYDNYDAINVDKVKDIPVDYFETIGVPITFLDKYNPEQFEILGITDRQNTSGLRNKKYSLEDNAKFNDLNARSVIRNGDTYKAIYVRLLIKKGETNG